MDSILIGCPKKTVVKEEPSIKKEAEPTREMKRKEEQGAKEFGKSLVAKKEPGIEGEVLESKLLKDIHFDFDKYNIRREDAEILKGKCSLVEEKPQDNDPD